MSDFAFTELLPLGHDDTPYRLVSTDGVSVVDTPLGPFLKVAPEALTLLTQEAMHDIAHFLRPGHLQQLRNILDDPEASDNDRFVALDLLKNANIAAGGVLPMCQDTGTAIVKGKKGQFVFTGGNDEMAIARGVQNTYLTSNLRYSQMAPLTMYEEKNTGTNLPAEIKISAIDGEAYKFLFMAKGGGSANKSYLFQETKALLNDKTLLPWLFEKMKTLGTAACPPYHLAVVIGGTSAELAVETAKLASARYLDTLPTEGLDPRARLPRRRARGQGARAVAADRHRRSVRRQVLLPRRARHPPAAPRRELPGGDGGQLLRRPPGARQDHPRGRVPRATRDRSGSLHARCRALAPRRRGRRRRGRADRPHPADVRDPRHAVQVPGEDPRDAHRADGGRARHRPREVERAPRRGQGLPQYMKDHCVYYAGPAKTPEGMASGSFGPTTAGRMDSYVDEFQAAGGSFVMLAKGNRSRQVTDACKAHGGFYLGSIGGPAARLAQDCITKVEVLEYPELGMEAVWKIEVQDFPRSSSSTTRATTSSTS
jgi:fumarate hydratase class I